MYNVFKRPMFKLGGQADQGTGIMSHVEPRSNYMFGNIAQPLTPFQDTYINLPAYAYGGRIGYAGAGPVMPGTLPILENRKIFDEQQRALQQANREQLGITSIPVKKESSEGFLSSIFGPSADERLLIEKGLLSPNATAREKIDAIKNLKLARSTGERAEKYPSEDIGIEKESKINEYKTNEGKITDPREKIKEEAEMLKNLLRDEKLTTAENALIIAKALGTPGGINAKIAAAGEMAIPVLRERAKLDKEATLEAYKTMKEIEKSKISAGAMSATEKLIERDVINTMNMAKKTIGPNGEVLYDGLTEQQIRSQVMGPFVGKSSIEKIAAAKETIFRLEKQADTLKLSTKPEDIEKLKQINKRIEEIKRDYRVYATGGRVSKAIGGMSMEETTIDDTTGEKTQTVVDTNVEGFPMKPVQKLSFEEIRNRLPKEITDDIVRLLANSAEALQDFAYIKTQQDVNKFNVKYGVNLVLPQNV